MKRKYKPKLKEGDVFGHLKAIAYVGHKTTKNGLISQWLFKCSCGRNTVKDDVQVRRGQTKRCNRGCHKYLGKGIALENALYEKYKRTAKDRNIDFNLTKEELVNLSRQNCSYCNIPPKQIYYKHKKTEGLIYNGIDRYDNNKGYVIDNCLPCCITCNKAKNNMSAKDFFDWLERVYNHCFKTTEHYEF